MADLKTIQFNKLLALYTSRSLAEHGAYALRLVLEDNDVASAVVSHPLGDDWLDYLHVSLEAAVNRRKGALYAVVNSLEPSQIKVGLTSQKLSHRLKQLNNEAVFGTLTDIGSWAVVDRFYAEKIVHKQLKLKFPCHKEYFIGHYSDIFKEIEACVSHCNNKLKLIMPSDFFETLKAGLEVNAC